MKINRRPANGTRGFLLRTGDSFVFRVYGKQFPEGFQDYDISHTDLEVTITTDIDDAYFYDPVGEENGILDHSPAVRGLP